MDRDILLYGGIIGTMVVRILMFPLPGGEHPPTPPETSTGEIPGADFARNQDCETSNGAAPLCTHDWCETQPAINLVQHIAVILLVSIPYPMCMGVLQALVSKILGPRPQVVKYTYCSCMLIVYAFVHSGILILLFQHQISDCLFIILPNFKVKN